MFPLYVLGVAAALAAGSIAQTTSRSSSPVITSLTTSTSGSSSSTASTTTSSAVTTQTVSVGANGYVYSPRELNASIGDIIEFMFYPGGHSVVRAEYKYPCIPYELTGPGKVGFFSGIINPLVISSNPPTWQLRINDTNPVFFYCSAPGSCYQHQMIGVINANSTETFNVQMEYTENATTQLSPGQGFPTETASSASSTPISSSAPVTASSDSGGSSLSAGAIAGIAIGAAAFVVLVGSIIYLCGRRGGIKTAYRTSRATFGPPMPYQAPKSPGNATFSTQYSPPPDQERFNTQSPPPPISPNTNSSYSGHTYTNMSALHSPFLGDTQGIQSRNGYVSVPGQHTPPDRTSYQQHTVPVELPASTDPGNSPLPEYPTRHFSWAQGAENQYRPASKSDSTTGH